MPRNVYLATSLHKQQLQWLDSHSQIYIFSPDFCELQILLPLHMAIQWISQAQCVSQTCSIYTPLVHNWQQLECCSGLQGITITFFVSHFKSTGIFLQIFHSGWLSPPALLSSGPSHQSDGLLMGVTECGFAPCNLFFSSIFNTATYASLLKCRWDVRQIWSC